MTQPSGQHPDPTDPLVGASGEDDLEALASTSPAEPADPVGTTGQDDTVEPAG